MPQGWKHSPWYFNSALKKDLSSLELPVGCLFIEYVDNLLLAAPDPVSCLETTTHILNRLAQVGYKVQKEKLQICRRCVIFLGRTFSPQGTGLTDTQSQAILQHGKPVTV
ncbi:hypothetical protein NQD34_001490 [Periophthalmus magnuspinnatus]|nr:hypothetical protein NQD34_001490 [Periophthalmus magnuspinnatus]